MFGALLAGAAAGSKLNPAVNGASYSLNAFAFDPQAATASLEVNTNGDLILTGIVVSTVAWLLSGPSSSYEVQATVTSGTLTSGTTGSYLALSSSRTWSVVRSTLGTSDATISVTIRKIAKPSDSVTFTVQLPAQVESLN